MSCNTQTWFKNSRKLSLMVKTLKYNVSNKKNPNYLKSLHSEFKLNFQTMSHSL